MVHRCSAAGAPKISVVVPCRNEAGNLPVLIDEIGAALAERGAEVIVVDDGSTDNSADIVVTLGRSRPWLRLIRHKHACGQSAAVRTGLLAARGDIIATIDGDGQNDPRYLPVLVDKLVDGGKSLGIVAGQRRQRTDSGLKQAASRFANRLRGALLKDGTADSGCGLKALRREVFLLLPYFDGWHRYLPALVLREGLQVAHVDVVDRQRQHGVSNYGIVDRGLAGVLDLFGVWWLRRRRKRVPEITEVEIDDR